MITITNASATSTVINGKLTAVVEATITDTLASYVGGTVSWGDGTVTAIARQANPVQVGAQHTYSTTGNFTITLTAVNFRVPLPDSAVWTGFASYYSTPTGVPPTPVTQTSYTYIGPILPRDTGSPNSQDWDWNLATDTILVEASLRTLMLTNKGEYLMDANYGANLRSLVFSPDDSVLLDLIKSDISDALSAYEPRAQLGSINVAQDGNVAQVSANFISTLAPGNVPLQLTFTV